MSVKMSGASIPLLRLPLPPQTLPFNFKPSSLLLHKYNTPRLLTPAAANIPPFLGSRSRIKRPTTTVVSASYNPIPATDRLISSVAYFLPFFNGIQYGRFLFSQYPVLAVPFSPLIPLFNLYRSIPYASFVAFFALYLGIVRNPGLSRFVRFNALQAVVLDVLLVVPLLMQRIFSPGRAGIGFKLMVMGHNALFVFVVGCFLYSLVFCILGKTPYLPFVADAASRQL